jgi:hypothetical protein
VMLMRAFRCSKLSQRGNMVPVTSLAICCTIVIVHAGSSSGQILYFFNTDTVSLKQYICCVITEDGGSTFFRNIGTVLPDCRV